MLPDSHLADSDRRVQEHVKRAPREVAECRAEALRGIRRYAISVNVSMARARDAYNRGVIEVSPETREAIPTISAGQVKRWSRKFRERRLAGLLPPKGSRAGSAVMARDGELLDFVVAMLGHNHLLSARLIWVAMVKYFEPTGRRLPSCGAFRRWLRAWKLSHREHFERLSNPDGHRSKFLVSLGRQHGMVSAPLEVVEFDGTPANQLNFVEVLCGGERNFVTAAIDIYTRWPFVVVSKTAAVDASLLVFRKMALTVGIPGTVVIDRGSEYGRRFKTCVAHCGCALDEKPAYQPQLKGHIERFFGTLATSFFPALPGFIGRNVGERAAIRSRWSYAARHGKDAVAIFEISMTAAELQERIDAWVREVYCRTPHAGLGGKTPEEKMREAVGAGWVAKRLPTRELDVLLSDVGRPRVVSKRGVHYDGATFWHNGLIPYLGAPVRISVSENLGELHVFDSEGRFICVAECCERLNLDRRAMAVAARAAQREYLREARRRDRACARRYRRELLEAVVSNRAAIGQPLMPVETADAPALEAARAAVSGKKGRVAATRIQTAAESAARWTEYERVKGMPAEMRTEKEREILLVYEASPAFAARQRLGAAG